MGEHSTQRFNQNEPTISLGYFNNILFTYFQISKLTGLTLYEVSTQQPNVTTTLTVLRQQSEIP